MADFVIVIYNPKSKKRNWQLKRAQELIIQALVAREVYLRGRQYVVRDGATERLQLKILAASGFENVVAAAGGVVAPMPGQVVKVEVAVDDPVKAGQVLVVVEAMKMEHSITASADGKVKAVHFGVGDKVDEGVELIAIE